jgi:hypothetical protein
MDYKAHFTEGHKWIFPCHRLTDFVEIRYCMLLSYWNKSFALLIGSAEHDSASSKSSEQHQTPLEGFYFFQSCLMTVVIPQQRQWRGA